MTPAAPPRKRTPSKSKAATPPPKPAAPPKTAAQNGSVNEPEEPQVLDLVSLAPVRRLVKLPTTRHPEGEDFELRLVDDFGIEAQQKLLAWSRRFQALMQQEDELGKDEAERLRFLLNSLFEIVLDAPESAKRDMPDSVRARVVQAFSWAPVLARQEQQTELIRRLIEKEHLTEEQVNEVVVEMRNELASTMAS